MENKSSIIQIEEKSMTELETIKRKIFLKNQARKLLQAEKDNLNAQGLLIKMKGYFEKQINPAEEQKELSRQLDCVEFLLQAVRERR